MICSRLQLCAKAQFEEKKISECMKRGQIFVKNWVTKLIWSFYTKLKTIFLSISTKFFGYA